MLPSFQSSKLIGLVSILYKNINEDFFFLTSRWHSILCSVSVLHPFTFSGGRGSCSQPRVSCGIGAALDETLCFFIADECEVSAASLAPSAGDHKRTPQTHKLKAGVSEEVLAVRTGERNICSVLGGEQAAQCQQQQQQQEQERGSLTHPLSHTVHFQNQCFSPRIEMFGVFQADHQAVGLSDH